ncbi:MAG TPA: hypothetical protein VLH56_11810 [Dissulfurispiraceae bacterium]|nr:hypothetical protein [Dissulfurispiraceae bacterium]
MTTRIFPFSAIPPPFRVILTGMDNIQKNADRPKSATVDGNNVTRHSLPDQIAADKYARAKSALAGNPWNRLRRGRFIPGGSV